MRVVNIIIVLVAVNVLLQVANILVCAQMLSTVNHRLNILEVSVPTSTNSAPSISNTNVSSLGLLIQLQKQQINLTQDLIKASNSWSVPDWYTVLISNIGLASPLLVH